MWLVCDLVSRQHLLNHPPEDYAATFDEDTRHGDDTVSFIISRHKPLRREKQLD